MPAFRATYVGQTAHQTTKTVIIYQIILRNDQLIYILQENIHPKQLFLPYPGIFTYQWLFCLTTNLHRKSRYYYTKQGHIEIYYTKLQPVHLFLHLEQIPINKITAHRAV